MSEQNNNYIWRCAKCSYHFVNVSKIEGIIKAEKKCPKCKALNIMTISNSEISISCKPYDSSINGYDGVGYY